MAARQLWKKTTGFTGLPVCEHPQHVLSVVYGKILRALQKVPSEAAYRKHTEKIINDRLIIVQSEGDPAKLEEKLGQGKYQLEEIIVQAQNELKLARNVSTWRVWEPLVQQAPTDQWRWPT